MHRSSDIRRFVARLGAGVGIMLAPALAHADARCLEGTPTARELCATGLYTEGRFAEAAAAFEALWEEHGHVKLLFNAGLAREAAGSDGWALSHFLKYLRAPGLTEREREEGLERVEGLRERLVSVEIVLRPATAMAPTATLLFERQSPAGSEAFTYPLAILLTPAGLRAELERGLWSVTVEPGRAQAEGDARKPVLFLAGNAEPVVVELKPSRTTARRRKGSTRERQIIQAFAGGAAGLAAIGVVLTSVGLAAEADGFGTGLGAQFAPQKLVARDQSLAAWGGGLLGGGLGLGVSAGLEATAPSRTREVLTFVAGGGVAVVGLVWHSASFVAYQRAGKGEAPAGHVPLAAVEGKGPVGAATAALFGLGASVVAAATIAHFTRAGGTRSKGLRAGLAAGPFGAAVSIRGRF